MTAFDDRGVTNVVDFDFDQVDRNLVSTSNSPQVSFESEPVELSRDELSIAVLQVVLDWIIQTVPKNMDGIEIRATIAGWIFLPYLRKSSLTEISALVGRDKQSLGRWVDDFKVRFPGIYYRISSAKK